MPKPTNKKLYEKVKGQIQRQLKAKGQRWSARASQQLVSEYKKQGGKQYRCLPKTKAQSLSKSQRSATAKKKLKNPSAVVKNTKRATVKNKKR